MPCERYRDALTDAAAGEPVTSALEAHLDGCAACRSELAALQRLIAAADDELSALATAEPSHALRARIRESVAESSPAAAFRWGFAWTATAAAVLALAVFGVWREPVARGPVSPSVAVNAPPPAPALSPLAATSPAPLPSESNHEAASGAARRDRRVERPSRRGEPAVLVPAGELDAVLRFASHLQARTVLPDSLIVADLSGSLPEPRPLEIAPISIAALDLTDTSGRD